MAVALAVAVVLAMVLVTGVDCLRKQMFPCSCQLADNLYGLCFMCQLKQFVAAVASARILQSVCNHVTSLAITGFSHAGERKRGG